MEIIIIVSQFYVTYCVIHKILNLLTHTHTFNGPLSGTTRVNQYRKGETNLDFTEARDSEWQWHLTQDR